MLPITVPGLIAQFIKDADPRFRDADARRAV
jgi:hypothetical protein